MQGEVHFHPVARTHNVLKLGAKEVYPPPLHRREPEASCACPAVEVAGSGDG